jgi:hypothetical protein
MSCYWCIADGVVSISLPAGYCHVIVWRGCGREAKSDCAEVVPKANSPGSTYNRAKTPSLSLTWEYRPGNRHLASPKKSPIHKSSVINKIHQLWLKFLNVLVWSKHRYSSSCQQHSINIQSTFNTSQLPQKLPFSLMITLSLHTLQNLSSLWTNPDTHCPKLWFSHWITANLDDCSKPPIPRHQQISVPFQMNTVTCITVAHYCALMSRMDARMKWKTHQCVRNTKICLINQEG